MIARVRVLIATLALVGCRTGAEETPDASTTSVAPPLTEVARVGTEAGPEAVLASSDLGTPVGTRASYTPASTLGDPVAIRRAGRSRPIYVEPSKAAALRGRIEMFETFAVHSLVDAGGGCSEPWAQVGEAAWVCTKYTSEDLDAEPHVLPRLPKGKLLPFIYARHVAHKVLTTPKLPVYRHLTGLRAGAEPVDWLAAYGTYAFVRRTRGSNPVLIDVRGRVVPADQMRTLKPSELAGRDLETSPIPTDRSLAWVVSSNTGVFADPDPESALQRLDYHAEVLVTDETALGRGRKTWIRVPAARAGETGQPATEGWILADDIRMWKPLPPPEPILAGQLLVDVDLDEQTLTLWVEDVPVFATLIASGKPGYSTPVGLYRIITKRAYGKMASLPGEPEPYWVDAVPWTMYFDGRFALHGAFWHDRFGARTSHGCVNLSPHDAKFIFDHTTPTVAPGWLIANEHTRDPGSLVRVRKGLEPVPDRRTSSLEGTLAMED